MSAEQAQPKTVRITYREAMRAGDSRRADARPARVPDGRGCRTLRRMLRGEQGTAGGVRSRAHPRHAAVRVGLRRRRNRRGDGRDAADRRNHDGQLQPAGARPDREQRRDHPSHVGRPVQHSAGDPHDHRRRPSARRAAFAQPRGMVRAHPGHQGAHSGNARGRARDAMDGARGSRPGADFRARHALQHGRRDGRGRRRGRHRSSAAVRRAGHGRQPDHVWRHAGQDAGTPPSNWLRRESTRKCWTCARCARSTPTPSSIR